MRFGGAGPQLPNPAAQGVQDPSEVAGGAGHYLEWECEDYQGPVLVFRKYDKEVSPLFIFFLVVVVVLDLMALLLNLMVD